MPRNVPCKFHLQGRCTRGNDCAFYHGPVAEPSQPEVCRYYASGFCAAGEGCRFWHPGHEPATPSSATHAQDGAQEGRAGGGEAGWQPGSDAGEGDGAQWWPNGGGAEHAECGEWTGEECADYAEYGGEEGEAAEDDGPYNQDEWEAWAVEQPGPEWQHRSLCARFQADGHCPRWRTCAQPHGDRCETCGRWCLHPYSPSQRAAHAQACGERAERAAFRAASEAQECCICLERVLGKPGGEARFGLLACEHAFCLGCVRGWRSQLDSAADLDTALRACPLCRQTCHFVTPSRVWPRSPEEKQSIIQAYKARLGAIDCKYWEASPPGDRRCPFGTSCFYRHQGAELVAPRKYISADGEVKFGARMNLADFLGNLGL